MALLGLLVVTACTGTSEDDARTAAEQFAQAVNNGDFEQAGSLTTQPDKAAADLAFSMQQLQDADITYALGQITTSGEQMTASYDVQWNVLEEELSFTVDATLAEDADGTWLVQWAPSVIHPDLTADRHLEVVHNDGVTPTVVDRTHQPLLSEQLVTVIRITPDQVLDPEAVSQAVAEQVSIVVPSITAESLLEKIDTSNGPFTVVALRDVDLAQIQIPDLPGISHNQQARLLTATKTLKSPALAGMNDIFTEISAQSAGWRLEVQDAQHEAVETLIDVPGNPVSEIVTTFDASIHAAAQAAVDAVDGQAMIVAIQPSTGGILTVAQNSAADAEGPIALTGQYPPGSSFKIVTTAAALDAGAATPESVLACPPVVTINGRTIPNDGQFDLGQVPLHTAFAQSCNTTMAALAAELPADALQAMAARMGLGVDYVAAGLPTISGSVPAAADDAEMVEGAIGQGKVVASPLGMALVAATVAAGQAPLPTLLPDRETTADQSPAALDPAVIEALRSMMLQAVQSGTATAVADLAGLGGKTGTAQYGDGSSAHGWFVGYYKDMAFAVLLVGAGSSGPAVDTAGAFIRPIQDLIPT